ncbi:unnamed protein product [Chrysoparadoxa australica]
MSTLQTHRLCTLVRRARPAWAGRCTASCLRAHRYSCGGALCQRTGHSRQDEIALHRPRKSARRDTYLWVRCGSTAASGGSKGAGRKKEEDKTGAAGVKQRYEEYKEGMQGKLVGYREDMEERRDDLKDKLSERREDLKERLEEQKEDLKERLEERKEHFKDTLEVQRDIAREKVEGGKKSFRTMWRQYGIVAVGTYFSVYGLTLGSLYLVFDAGFLTDADVPQAGQGALETISGWIDKLPESLSKWIKKIGDKMQEDPSVRSLVLAWLTAKATEPLRIFLTIGITPKVS